MQKIEHDSCPLEHIERWSFVGDPGCDGLGAEIMSIFNATLQAAAGDFILVGGDIVPNGNHRFYKSVVAMTTVAVNKPVYVLRGNHDQAEYENYFGQSSYFIYDDRLLLIVLDNSARVFSESSQAVLARAVTSYARENIVLAFHIPPPNKISANSVTLAEWEKIRTIIAPYKSQIKYIVCGHIHSYFEDELDGIRIIASGGGGARIESVENIPTPYYHFVEFYFANGHLTHAKKTLLLKNGTEKNDAELTDALQTAYQNECMAHLRYHLYAEDAEKQNKPGLAMLFRAAADAEYYHARNHYFVLGKVKELITAVAESAAGECAEVEKFYPASIALAHRLANGLAEYTFKDAREAEKIHLKLFQTAQKTLKTQPDIPMKVYHTCTSCGYTWDGETSPKICPICGAPTDKIKVVNAS